MKRVHHWIHQLIDKILSIIKYCFRIMNEDRLLLLVFIFFFFMDLVVKAASGMSLFNVRSFLFNFTWVALLVSFSYNFKTYKNRRRYVITIITFHFVLTLGNNIYYRYYQSFLSLSIIKQIQLFAAMPDSGDIGLELITLTDILTVIIFIGTLYVIKRFTNSNQQVYENKTNAMRRFTRGNFLRLSGISFLMGILFMQGAQYSQVSKMWNRPIVVENFGLPVYHLVDSVKSVSLFIDFEISDEDYNRFVEYFQQREQERTPNEYTNIFEDKNVIVIHAESIENFVINKTINGQEITPNINRLANSGYYYSNMYPQQSVGTSSDTEFTFATSLLPVNMGTIFMEYFDHTYMTTQKLLQEKGYHTVSMHGNNGWFWNRSIMHPALGFDEFLNLNNYYDGYPKSEDIGLGISDKAFFEKSMEYLLEVDQAEDPYYAHLITLTNHTPWADADKYVTIDENGEKHQLSCGTELEKTQLCRYLQAVNYADYAIGQLMEMLGQNELLDDTIVVIYGDHPANLKKEELETFYQMTTGEEVKLSPIAYQVQQQVPFIIWSEDIVEPQTFTQAIGMLDAAPILQNMLGIHNPFNLGRDYPYEQEAAVINDDTLDPYAQHIVPFVNGDWSDGNIYYNEFRKDYVIINDAINPEWITKEYLSIQKKRVSEVIEMSNLINRYDAIYEYYKRENLTQEDNFTHERGIASLEAIIEERKEY